MVREAPAAKSAMAVPSSAELVNGEYALEQLSWNLALSEVVA
jgi:hypothetical protein